MPKDVKKSIAERLPRLEYTNPDPENGAIAACSSVQALQQWFPGRDLMTEVVQPIHLKLRLGKIVSAQESMTVTQGGHVVATLPPLPDLAEADKTIYLLDNGQWNNRASTKDFTNVSPRGLNFTQVGNRVDYTNPDPASGAIVACSSVQALRQALQSVYPTRDLSNLSTVRQPIKPNKVWRGTFFSAIEGEAAQVLLPRVEKRKVSDVGFEKLRTHLKDEKYLKEKDDLADLRYEIQQFVTGRIVAIYYPNPRKERPLGPLDQPFDISEAYLGTININLNEFAQFPAFERDRAANRSSEHTAHTARQQLAGLHFGAGASSGGPEEEGHSDPATRANYPGHEWPAASTIVPSHEGGNYPTGGSGTSGSMMQDTRVVEMVEGETPEAAFQRSLLGNSMRQPVGQAQPSYQEEQEESEEAQVHAAMAASRETWLREQQSMRQQIIPPAIPVAAVPLGQPFYWTPAGQQYYGAAPTYGGDLRPAPQPPRQPGYDLSLAVPQFGVGSYETQQQPAPFAFARDPRLDPNPAFLPTSQFAPYGYSQQPGGPQAPLAALTYEESQARAALQASVARQRMAELAREGGFTALAPSAAPPAVTPQAPPRSEAVSAGNLNPIDPELLREPSLQQQSSRPRGSLRPLSSGDQEAGRPSRSVRGMTPPQSSDQQGQQQRPSRSRP